MILRSCNLLYNIILVYFWKESLLLVIDLIALFFLWSLAYILLRSIYMDASCVLVLHCAFTDNIHTALDKTHGHKQTGCFGR